ncbi:hypothetical protein GQ602_001524 [Ophiocordyceps camponoti-floridani]|uniref:Uncharacterized protein n=1 Tax=Ophiocordyceps camponoti-floridani TaxID=2030778 RepID=A0A8H4QE77_9HYPO|nr:hypothetical protein GQ602_001524 [Ophiocordyceps camponoti-floridani]
MKTAAVLLVIIGLATAAPHDPPQPTPANAPAGPQPNLQANPRANAPVNPFGGNERLREHGRALPRLYLMNGWQHRGGIESPDRESPRGIEGAGGNGQGRNRFRG